MPTERLFLFSDLDRTLLPNGSAPESPRARPLLRALSSRPEFQLVYVSGRHLELIEAGLAEYDLPRPRYLVGDVGTSIYRAAAKGWARVPQWNDKIGPDWSGHSRADLAALLADLRDLEPQEEAKQNEFKLSYYASASLESAPLLKEIQRRLQERQVRASLIWSIDELEDRGLLDVLPASATKLHAVEFLAERERLAPDQFVFAGDSGNDLAALTSGLRAVLVRNALPEVRAEAEATVARRNLSDRLYVARGGFLGMNGNYSAGVLEGLAHHLPAVAGWLEELASDQPPAPEDHT